MTHLDNYRTHYCPDSGFSLVSENDAEFEACNCFRIAINQVPVTGLSESEAVVRNSPLVAEQLWYRTISALARVCGTGRSVQVEPVVEHQDEQVPVTVRKA